MRALAPGSRRHTEIVGLRDRYEAHWRDTLRDGVDDGTFRIADQRLTRIALLSMCSNVSEWYRPADDGASISHGFAEIGPAAVRASRRPRGLGGRCPRSRRHGNPAGRLGTLTRPKLSTSWAARSAARTAPSR
ncbi:hypothetical protein ACW9HJ_29905 [Nocardia gipuzkoensis]